MPMKAGHFLFGLDMEEYIFVLCDHYLPHAMQHIFVYLPFSSISSGAVTAYPGAEI